MNFFRCISVLLLLSMLRADEKALMDLLVEKGMIEAGEAERMKATPIVKAANPWVRTVEIRGRVQSQFGYVDARNNEADGRYSTFEIRRAFIGLKAQFDHDVVALLEANFVPGENVTTTNAYLQWRKHKAAMVKVGFEKPFTAMEEVASSASIITLERSHITNTVAAPGEMTGILLEGEHDPFYYGLGVFTGEDNRNADNVQVDYLYNALAGLRLDGLGSDKVKLKLQTSYLAGEDPEAKFTFDSMLAGSLQFGFGAFELLAETFFADSDSDGTQGFYVMPSYRFSPRYQGVLRYEQADSDQADGLRANSRYVRRVDFLEDNTLQRGDEHQALYLGLNLYLQGDGNKLMFAVEFGELSGTPDGTLDSTTFYTAWRTLF